MEPINEEHVEIFKINEEITKYGIQGDNGAVSRKDECEVSNKKNIKVEDRYLLIKNTFYYNCKYCQFMQVVEPGHHYMYIFRTHMQEMHFVCYICDARFEDTNELGIHYKSHKTKEGKFVCNSNGCSYERSNISGLFTHARAVHNGEWFTCDECPKKYMFLYELADHKKNHVKKNKIKELHKNKIRKGKSKMCERTVCKVCGKSRTNIKQHVKLQHTDLPLMFCSLCTYSTKNKIELKLHEKGHGEKFKCNQCNFSCKRINSLKVHKRFKHDGIGYKCSICDHTVRRAHILRQHMEIHNEPTLQCQRCELKANGPIDLKRHMERHNPKYLCDKCDYKTYDAGNFTVHKIVKHGNDILKCSLCKYETKSKRSLKKHKTKHPEEDAHSKVQNESEEDPPETDKYSTESPYMKNPTDQTRYKNEIIKVEASKFTQDMKSSPGKACFEENQVETETSCEDDANKERDAYQLIKEEPQVNETLLLEKITIYESESLKSWKDISQAESYSELHGVENIQSGQCELCHFKGGPNQPAAQLRKHVTNIHLICEFCDYKFRNEVEIETHFQTTHKAEGGKLVCKFNGCLYTSMKKQNMFIHKQSDHKGVWLQCNECDSKFRETNALSVHKKMRHPLNTMDIFTNCKTCDKMLSIRSVSDHMKRKHTDQTKSFCSQCKFSTKDPIFLKVHEQAHVSKLKCDVCKFSCVTPTTMRQHNKFKHKGAEMYRCNLCDYKGESNGKLRHHVLIHSEPSFKCGQCDYKGKGPHNLKQHMKKHEGPKYFCSHCDYKTYDLANFGVHKTVKHGTEVLQCGVCKFETKSKRALRQHKQKAEH